MAYGRRARPGDRVVFPRFAWRRDVWSSGILAGVDVDGTCTILSDSGDVNESWTIDKIFLESEYLDAKAELEYARAAHR
jgi:hypothetical protein